jgi:hypothetical protein
MVQIIASKDGTGEHGRTRAVWTARGRFFPQTAPFQGVGGSP